MSKKNANPKALELRLVGMRLTPASEMYAGVDLDELDRMLSEGRFDPGQFPAPVAPVTPIFADDDGNHYFLAHGDNGPVAILCDPGTETDLNESTPLTGGYVSTQALEALGSRSGTSPLHANAANAARAMIAQAAGGQGGVEAMALSIAKGLGQNAAGAFLAALASGGSAGNAMQSVGSMLGLSSGISALAQQGLSIGVSQGLGLAMSSLMSAWAPDNDASTGEQIAHKFANDLAASMQAELQGAIGDQLANSIAPEAGGCFGTGDASSMTGANATDAADSKSIEQKVKEFFAGPSSNATLQALRLGDADVKGNVITAGMPDVLAEGKPIARLGDPVDKTGVQVYMGAATVFGGAQMAGQQTVSMSADGPFPKGAPTVLIGGPAGGSPPPPATGESPSSSASSSKSGASSGNAGDAGNGAQAGKGTGEREIRTPAQAQARINEIRERLRDSDLSPEEEQRLIDENNELEKRFGRYFPDYNENAEAQTSSKGNESEPQPQSNGEPDIDKDEPESEDPNDMAAMMRREAKRLDNLSKLCGIAGGKGCDSLSQQADALNLAAAKLEGPEALKKEIERQAASKTIGKTIDSAAEAIKKITPPQVDRVIDLAKEPIKDGAQQLGGDIVTEGTICDGTIPWFCDNFEGWPWEK